MALERQNQIYAEARAAAGGFIEAWRRLQDARDAYDAVGGTPFFTTYFEGSPTPELTSNEFLGLMNTTNAIDTLMAAGHSTNLHKARG